MTKNIRKLTINDFKELIKNTPKEQSYGALVERHKQATPEEKTALEKEYPSLQPINIKDIDFAISPEIMQSALAVQTMTEQAKIMIEAAYIPELAHHATALLNNPYPHPPKIQPSLSLSEMDRDSFKKTNATMDRLSREIDIKNAQKEKLEQDRHSQLIAALGKNSSNQTMQDEIKTLKAEIQELKKENSKLQKQLNENPRERNNVLKIIAILADMANLKIDTPFKSFDAMQAHADRSNLKIPSKDTVAKWFKEIESTSE